MVMGCIQVTAFMPSLSKGPLTQRNNLLTGASYTPLAIQHPLPARKFNCVVCGAREFGGLENFLQRRVSRVTSHAARRSHAARAMSTNNFFE